MMFAKKLIKELRREKKKIESIKIVWEFWDGTQWQSVDAQWGNKLDE